MAPRQSKIVFWPKKLKYLNETSKILIIIYYVLRETVKRALLLQSIVIFSVPPSMGKYEVLITIIAVLNNNNVALITLSDGQISNSDNNYGVIIQLKEIKLRSPLNAQPL